jgi:acyl-CoA reductase-like NAD-dependent aldehyde dehydrogenase
VAVVKPIENANGAAMRYRVTSPVDGHVVGEFDATTPEQVREAVARARAAQPEWAAKGFRARGKILQRALDILIAEQDEYVRKIGQETGRNPLETLFMEIWPACDSLNYYSRRAGKILGDRRIGLHVLKHKRAKIVYRPLGVVGVITPWNGPFILALNPTVQALMAGNTVIVKPSEITPFCGKLVETLLNDAGLPKNVCQVLLGDGTTGAAVVDAGLDKIHFTGSVATGRKIGEACGRNLIPCVLELGGKDPMIVCSDADLDRATAGAVFGAIQNTGQFCSSTERIYVVAPVYDEFVARVVARVKALRQTNQGETDVGPFIMDRQLDIVEAHVQDAVAKGAVVETGGSRNTAAGDLYYLPTVLTGVTHEMDVMTQETFGPILPIVRVRDEGEAIAMANDTQFGLGATVWTRDTERGERIARKLNAGAVVINDASITYGALELPFGGRRASGVGCVNGESGLRSFCHAQPILTDRFGLKEEMVWYPYTAKKRKSLQGAIRWVFGKLLRRFFS